MLETISTSKLNEDAPLTEDVSSEQYSEYTQQRLQEETLENVQAFEMERVKSLYYGKQFELLPHIRCYQCGKFIGDQWLPYLQSLKEKMYKPSEVLDLLPITDDEKSALLEELFDNDGIRFHQMLNEIGVKRDFDVLYKTKKYTTPQIFDRLKLRNACCRMNFLSPIHIPLQRDAFEEPSKSKEILDPLSGMDAQPTHIEITKEKEKEKQSEEIETTSQSPLPLFPVMKETKTDEYQQLDELGSCKVGDVKQINQIKSSVVIPDVIPDDLLDDNVSEIQEVGEAVQKRRIQIDVGEGYFVRQEPRKYRAR